MKYRYSVQAQIIIDNLKDFNYDDFEKWHEERYGIGCMNIVEYITYIAEQKEKDKEEKEEK